MKKCLIILSALILVLLICVAVIPEITFPLPQDCTQVTENGNTYYVFDGSVTPVTGSQRSFLFFSSIDQLYNSLKYRHYGEAYWDIMRVMAQDAEDGRLKISAAESIVQPVVPEEYDLAYTYIHAKGIGYCYKHTNTDTLSIRTPSQEEFQAFVTEFNDPAILRELADYATLEVQSDESGDCRTILYNEDDHPKKYQNMVQYRILHVDGKTMYVIETYEQKEQNGDFIFTSFTLYAQENGAYYAVKESKPPVDAPTAQWYSQFGITDFTPAPTIWKIIPVILLGCLCVAELVVAAVYLSRRKKEQQPIEE